MAIAETTLSAMDAPSTVPQPLRLLFFKEQMPWPRQKGHDVHGYSMMRALAALGQEIHLVTRDEPDARALEGLPLASCRRLDDFVPAEGAAEPLPLRGWQEKFRSYYGVEPVHIHALGRAVEETGADAVVVVGLLVLPYLAAVRDAVRIWYAADEWLWHHLSLVQVGQPATWKQIKTGLLKGLYERAYASLIDRVWVVSRGDQRAMRWVAGIRHADLLPNGVDGEYYQPQPAEEIPNSSVFWGRLDFEPNIQGLQWFCRRIWPSVRRAVPDARLAIYGFNPVEEIRQLAGRDGIELHPDVPDLRPEIARHQVVVLPFVSGGGIKNKLLEAAAMGKPIVCTPRACGGLQCDGTLPVLTAKTPAQWVQQLQELWSNSPQRAETGAATRRWVLEHHSWQATARSAITGVRESLQEKAAR